jgi:hypothetical protein
LEEYFFFEKQGFNHSAGRPRPLSDREGLPRNAADGLFTKPSGFEAQEKKISERRDAMGSVVKKRKKKISKHKHRKLLKKTRVQRRKRK